VTGELLWHFQKTHRRNIRDLVGIKMAVLVIYTGVNGAA
jgi:hypothetical protein